LFDPIRLVLVVFLRTIVPSLLARLGACIFIFILNAKYIYLYCWSLIMKNVN